MDDAEQGSIVRRHGAWVTQDRVLVETLTSNGFHFTSPLDKRLNRETYFQRCWAIARTCDRSHARDYGGLVSG
jgi:hypothetical protein